MAEVGIIRDVRESVVRIDGLPSCTNGQIVELGNGVDGMIMGFTPDEVLVLVLGDRTRIKPGIQVHGRSESLRVPVGPAFIGRMVDAMCEPWDGGGPVAAESRNTLFHASVPLYRRRPVDAFLHTGIRFIDILLPVAKGERVLLMGDHGTGKTSLAVDTILNQHGRDMLCIYCAVGTPASVLQRTTGLLRARGCMEYTVVMAEPDSASAGDLFLLPFAAITMAEYFAGAGRDVLLVMDDLSRHARAYRQVSLLLDRPPGREAYPGDLFHVQSQLLERAGCFSAEEGGASISVMALAETLQEDLSGVIPTSLASICDGRLYIRGTDFMEGRRPAFDASMSTYVSGLRVQPPALRQLGPRIRLDLAAAAELDRIGQGGGLSDDAAGRLRRGRMMLTLLRQTEARPSSLAEQILLVSGLQLGLLDHQDLRGIAHFRDSILDYARSAAADLVAGLDTGGELGAAELSAVSAVIRTFLKKAS